jgi:hypothetical protein
MQLHVTESKAMTTIKLGRLGWGQNNCKHTWQSALNALVNLLAWLLSIAYCPAQVICALFLWFFLLLLELWLLWQFWLFLLLLLFLLALLWLLVLLLLIFEVVVQQALCCRLLLCLLLLLLPCLQDAIASR